MKVNFKNVVFSILISSVLISCSKTEVPVTPDVTEKITYTKNVKSIVDNSCATSGCHSAVNPAASIDLSTYAKVKNSAKNGTFHASIDNNTMPKGGSGLPSATKAIINKWKTDGYLEN